MYALKKTIGNIDARNVALEHLAIQRTHGLGFHEYLQMAEDLGATPVVLHQRRHVAPGNHPL